jgi:hypothetical protein
MKLQCEYCDEPFKIKNGWIKKTCPCDEEERMISLEEWYYRLFKIIYGPIDNRSLRA